MNLAAKSACSRISCKCLVQHKCSSTNRVAAISMSPAPWLTITDPMLRKLHLLRFLDGITESLVAIGEKLSRGPGGSNPAKSGLTPLGTITWSLAPVAEDFLEDLAYCRVECRVQTLSRSQYKRMFEIRLDDLSGHQPTSTKVICRACSASFSVISASSNAPRILARILSASLRLLSPGANRANSSCPK
jgi:hypothetical protein